MIVALLILPQMPHKQEISPSDLAPFSESSLMSVNFFFPFLSQWNVEKMFVVDVFVVLVVPFK